VTLIQHIGLLRFTLHCFTVSTLRQDFIILGLFSLYLSVVGQVVRTVHELLQGAPRPVGPLVAGRQLLGRRGSSITHVQGCFPRGSPLHVPPLAEVARHGVPQQSDVVELSVWGGRRSWR